MPTRADRIGLAAALAVPPAAAAALIPARGHTTLANTALAMVVVVVVIAVFGRRLGAAVAGFNAGVWFDFFLTRPYYSFTIASHDEAVTTALLMMVGLIVGELTVRSRRHRDHATTATNDIEAIHQLAEMVADGAEVDAVIRVATHHLVSLLGLRDCWFETTFAERPGVFVERSGAIVWGSIQWSPQTMGLPGSEVTLVVQGQGLPYGRFVLAPAVGVPVEEQRLRVAVAIADQVGAALAARAVA